MKKKSLMVLINTVEEKFLVYSFLLSVVLIFMQICMRAFLNNSLPWSEELARYLFIWQCWVGVSFAQRENKHIRIEVLWNALPERGRKWLDLFQMVLTLAIVVFLIYYGIQMILFLMAANTTSSAMKIPMWIVYTAMPLSCAVYGLRLVLRAVDLLRGKEVAL